MARATMNGCPTQCPTQCIPHCIPHMPDAMHPAYAEENRTEQNTNGEALLNLSSYLSLVNAREKTASNPLEWMVNHA